MKKKMKMIKRQIKTTATKQMLDAKRTRMKLNRKTPPSHCDTALISSKVLHLSDFTNAVY